jgi:AcrR family transcriptional regulator
LSEDAGAGARGPRGARAGRREQTKAANRAAILRAAREVFGEIGYGAASVRDIVRRTDLATGTFYNYFPDKESVLRELVDEIAGEARRRVRAARLAAGSVEAFVGDSYRAYFALLAEDPETFALMRRNAGTIRALFGEPAVGASVTELREDLDAGVAAGALPPHDTELMAAAMVGAGLEVGVRMLEREPLDVDGAAAFVTRVFLAGLEAHRRDA